MRGLPVLVLAVLLLAGCSAGPDGPAAPAATPSVITDPRQGLNDTGAHIHDYWHGRDRLVVIGDEAAPDESGLGPGFATGRDVEVRTFRPSSGHVVPQGTASVEVTFSWTDAGDGLDSYTTPNVYVKTAGTNQSELLGETTNGGTLVVETGLPDADLPHQLLSAWMFELRMSAPDPMPLRFKGTVEVAVTAVRGLDLPVFPPHPDPWGTNTSIALVQGSGQLSYFADLGDGGCNGLSCWTVFTPASGAIVPRDTDVVEVEVTYSGAIPLELHYHGAESRSFQTMDRKFMEPGTGVTTAHYDLPIGDGGDGPYATQSQWEFSVRPATMGPVTTAWFADYTITASAVRHA